MLRTLEAAGVDIAMATNGPSGYTTHRARARGGHDPEPDSTSPSNTPDATIYRQVRGAESAASAAAASSKSWSAIDNPDRVDGVRVAIEATMPTLRAFPRCWPRSAFAVQRPGGHRLQRLRVAAGLFGRADLVSVFDELIAECDRHGVASSSPSRTDAGGPARPRSRPRAVLRCGRMGPDSHPSMQRALGHSFIDKDGRVFPCCFAASAKRISSR